MPLPGRPFACSRLSPQGAQLALHQPGSVPDDLADRMAALGRDRPPTLQLASK
jgi:hypothetical protein